MTNSGDVFDLDQLKDQLAHLTQQLEQPEIWQNPDKAKELAIAKAPLEALVTQAESLSSQLQELPMLFELADEEGDAQLFASCIAELEQLSKNLARFEFSQMFTGEHDNDDAYLDIQAGSGGTEAQDWANMLLRMYMRWAEHEGFTTEIMAMSDGEVAGIKSVTVKVAGPQAFGWLRTETGVHRLVRKSPFDSGNRRHTSFAAVFVSPIIADDVEIDELKEGEQVR